MRDFYASVSWCAYDIKELRPDWSDEQCVEFLEENEDAIQASMIERGWYALEDIIKRKESE
jgi:DNA modification methylase